MCPHIPLRENSDSEVDASKEETQKRNHSVHAYFLKTEIVTHAQEPKLRWVPCRRRNEGSMPREEKFGDLKEFGDLTVKEVNLETITDTQSWYKISPLSGYNLIRVRTRIRRRRRRVYEYF